MFGPFPKPKNSPLGPKKSKMTPKLSQNQMSKLKETKKIKVVQLHKRYIQHCKITVDMVWQGSIFAQILLALNTFLKYNFLKKTLDACTGLTSLTCLHKNRWNFVCDWHIFYLSSTKCVSELKSSCACMECKPYATI